MENCDFQVAIATVNGNTIGKYFGQISFHGDLSFDIETMKI